MGDNRDGATGEDLVLNVPDGTVVLDADGKILADLVGEGTSFEAAKGAAADWATPRWRRGHARRPDSRCSARKARRAIWCWSSNRSPTSVSSAFRLRESPRWCRCCRRLPKIADYPFTTLVPNLGVVQAAGDIFTIADVPGLIPGASTGRGLGLEFLRHLERCAVLAHVVDCATLEPGRDPVSDIDALEAELAAYRPALDADHGLGDLADRPRVVILNKIDVPDAAELSDFVEPELAQRGWPVFRISAVSHNGLRELTFALAKMVAEYRAAQPKQQARRQIIRPVAVDDSGFSVLPDPPSRAVSSCGRTSRTMDRANAVRQRRSGGLPRRPAQSPRRGRRAQTPRCRTRRAGHHRRHDLRLGADHTDG